MLNNDERQVQPPLWERSGPPERPPTAIPAATIHQHQHQHLPRGARPPGSQMLRLVVPFAVIALLSLVAVAFCMTSITSLRSTVSAQSAQITQLKQYMAQTQASTVNNGRSIAGLSSQVSGMYSTLNGVVAGYPEQCSIPLTGTDGAAIFYFKCSSKK